MLYEVITLPNPEITDHAAVMRDDDHTRLLSKVLELYLKLDSLLCHLNAGAAFNGHFLELFQSLEP